MTRGSRIAATTPESVIDRSEFETDNSKNASSSVEMRRLLKSPGGLIHLGSHLYERLYTYKSYHTCDTSVGQSCNPVRDSTIADFIDTPQ